jgi:hypothetical protein
VVALVLAGCAGEERTSARRGATSGNASVPAPATKTPAVSDDATGVTKQGGKKKAPPATPTVPKTDDDTTTGALSPSQLGWDGESPAGTAALVVVPTE